jgi:hypothetical protein
MKSMRPSRYHPDGLLAPSLGQKGNLFVARIGFTAKARKASVVLGGSVLCTMLRAQIVTAKMMHSGDCARLRICVINFRTCLCAF